MRASGSGWGVYTLAIITPTRRLAATSPIEGR